jgi:hypothetical protein
LAVHAPGEADLNLYAYVHGRVYVAVDPDGLDAAGLKQAVSDHDAGAAKSAMSDTSMSDALNVLDKAKAGDADWLYVATCDGEENRLSYAARTVSTKLMPVVNDGNSTHGWGLEAGDQSAAGSYLAGKYMSAAGVKGTEVQRSRTGAALVALNNIGMNDPSHIAYAMATIARETSWGANMKELASTKSVAASRGAKYVDTDYTGRGFIQLTHKANYVAFGRLLGADLAANPSLVADVSVAARVFALWWFNPCPYGRINIAHFGFDGSFGRLKSGTDARTLVNGNDAKDEVNANMLNIRLVMKPDYTAWTRTARGGE